MKLEVFCCSGGMAEGFRRAGVAFDFAVDADPDACESYESNLGHRPLQIDVRDLLRMARAGWRPKWVRLLVADPPCAPWSRAGKRKGTDDERDMLLETVELIQLLQPVAYLIGNVPGLDDADNWKKVVQPTLAQLQEAGYCIADFVSLDAADFGVPQHRRRPFWFGHLVGDCIRWPEPTHGDWSTMRLDGRKPWVTCRDALEHLPVDDLGRPVRLRKRACNGKQHGSVGEHPARVVGTSNLSDGNVLLPSEKHPYSRADEPALTIPCSQPTNGGAVLVPDRHGPSDPDAPSRTVGAVPRGREGQLLAWPWDRPSTTVTSRAGLPPPGHRPESGSIMSMPDAIVLSEKAAAILQGFPEDWTFAGKTKRARWSQIGQAMPPAMAEVVARSIVQWFADNTETPL